MRLCPCEQVKQLSDGSVLLPKDVARLVCALPSVLCSDEAADNVLEVIRLLRWHGVPDSALSTGLARCPEVFMMQVSLPKVLKSGQLCVPCRTKLTLYKVLV